MKYRFKTDWADKTMRGEGKGAREIARNEYQAGVSYSLDADTHARAEAAGVLGDGAPRALVLSLPEADIRKMLKDDLLDFILNGGTVDTSRIEAAEAARDSALAERDAARKALESADIEARALRAAWNYGTDEEAQARNLTDITAALHLAKKSA